MCVVGNSQKDLVGEVEQMTKQQAGPTEETDRPNIDDAGTNFHWFATKK